MGTLNRHILATLCALIVLVCPTAARSQTQPQVDETKAARLKAAYLRYVAEFTTWPDGTFASDNSPLVLCIQGADAHGIGQAISDGIREAGLSAGKHPLALSQQHVFAPGECETKVGLADSLSPCHLLFLTRSERARWARRGKCLEGAPIVTVAEFPGFAPSGGMIELSLGRRQDKPGSVGIDLLVNLPRLEEAGLRLSAKLLSLKQGVSIFSGSSPRRENNNVAGNPMAVDPNRTDRGVSDVVD